MIATAPNRPRLPSRRRPRRGRRSLGDPVRADRARSRSGRALLACNDEPYCLELVESGEPGHDHTGFELGHDCSLDDATAHLESKAVPWEEREGSPLRRRTPTGAVSSSCRTARRRPRSIAGRQHARPSTSVHLGGPRKLGHVNCLTGAIQDCTVLLPGRARHAGHRLARRRRRLVPRQRGPPRDGARGQGLRPLPPLRLRHGRHREDARHARPPRPATAAGSGGARRVTASARTSRATCASSRKPASSSSTATWSSSRTTTCPACFPDDPLRLEHLGAPAAAVVLPLRRGGDRVRAP